MSLAHVQGTASGGTGISRDIRYKYDYGELNFSPHGSLHKKLITKLMSRARSSHNEMQKRHPEWKEIDRVLTTYIPNTAKEEGKETKKTKKSVIVPISYAVLDTILSQLVATFLELPYYRFRGVGPEDRIGSILLEKDVEWQSVKKKHGLALHTMLRDAVTYGVGAVSPQWRTEEGVVYKSRSEFVEGEIPEGKKRIKSKGVIFEGNSLENIDPYNFLPDPNTPIHKLQESEYVGWVHRTNRISLLRREYGDDGYFNVKYLKHLGSAKSQVFPSDPRGDKSGLRGDKQVDSSSQVVDVIYLYVDLVEKDWGLSDSEKPHKWLFAIAGDEIIIQAERLEMPHNMFPVAVCAPEFDGHSIIPVSKIEMNFGLQDLVDFLYSSHMENVRKAINDMLVVDPSIINMRDLLAPGPGKVIRTRRTYWGRPDVAKNAVHQLPVVDITKSHLTDSANLIELMFRSSGANEGLQGVLRPRGERVSAQEARGTQLGALTRIDRSVRVASIMAFMDISYMIGANTQAYRKMKTYIKVSGRWEKDLRREYTTLGDQVDTASNMVTVHPSDLEINFDVLPYDGGPVGAEYAEVWVQLIQVLAQNPDVRAEFDMQRVVLHTFRLLGARNLDDFRRSPEEIHSALTDLVSSRTSPQLKVPFSENPLSGNGNGNLGSAISEGGQVTGQIPLPEEGE